MTIAQPPIRFTGPSEGTHATEEKWVEKLRDGTLVMIRPLHKQDLELERSFINGLSPRSRRFRFLDTIKAPSEALLKQLIEIDPSTDAAYVALIAEGVEKHQIGVARLSARPDGKECEFAVTVSDAWQGKGLGTILMRHLIDLAKTRGIESMYSSDATDNDLMRKFAAHLHLSHSRDPEESAQVIYSLDLKAPA